jgi:hypothetical protein
MVGRCALVCLLAGCGRIAFDPIGDDARRDGDGSLVNDDAATPCTTGFGPWSNLTHIGAANASTGYNEWQPTIHPNGLLLVFESDRPEGSGLYLMTRSSTSDAFGPARELTELYGAGTQDGGVSPVWSPDGTRLYYVRYVAVGSGAVSVPYLGGDSFGTATGEDLPYPEVDWDISADGLELFYTRDGGTETDIGHATRPTTSSPWTYDDALRDIIPPGDDEGWPTFDDARQELYFEASDIGAGYIARATRPGPGQPFSTPVMVSELQTSLGDPDITADGTTLVFASDRAPSAGAADLWIATRACL